MQRCAYSQDMFSAALVPAAQFPSRAFADRYATTVAYNNYMGPRWVELPRRADDPLAS